MIEILLCFLGSLGKFKYKNVVFVVFCVLFILVCSIFGSGNLVFIILSLVFFCFLKDLNIFVFFKLKFMYCLWEKFEKKVRICVIFFCCIIWIWVVLVFYFLWIGIIICLCEMVNVVVILLKSILNLVIVILKVCRFFIFGNMMVLMVGFCLMVFRVLVSCWVDLEEIFVFVMVSVMFVCGWWKIII